MIAWSTTLQQAAAGFTGIANAYLLDVQDANGNCYYWGSRQLTAPSVIIASDDAPSSNLYVPWILSVPTVTYNRSMKTDMGSIVLQNLSGDTLERDFERIVRGSTLEGALAVYREWNAGAQEAEIEFHGTLSFDDGSPTTASLSLRQLSDPSRDIAPQRTLCEICQWRWSSVQCGSLESTPCQQTYDTCQVIERQFLVLNNYEKNFGEAWANTATATFNRIRQI